MSSGRLGCQALPMENKQAKLVALASALCGASPFMTESLSVVIAGGDAQTAVAAAAADCAVGQRLIAGVRLTPVRKPPGDVNNYFLANLANGIPVFLTKEPVGTYAGETSCYLAVVVNAGSCDGKDCDADYSIAGLTEQMVLAGSGKYPKIETFQEYLNAHGITGGASTSMHHTTFEFRVPQTRSLAPLVDRLADCFLEPEFSSESVDHKAEGALDVHNKVIRSSQWTAWRAFALLRDPSVHDDPGALHKPMRNLARCVNRFWRKHYTADNIAIIVRSPLPEMEMLRVLRPFLSLACSGGKDAKHAKLTPPSSAGSLPSAATPLPGVLRVAANYRCVPQVIMKWLVPLEVSRDSKPLRLIAELLQREGPNSLQQQLKQLRWILSLSAAVQGNELTVTLQLPPQRQHQQAAKPHQVTAFVQSYLDALLAAGGIPQWFCDECAVLSQVAFSNAVRATSPERLADALWTAPATADALTNLHVIRRPDAAATNAVLSQLTSSRLAIVFISNDGPPSHSTDKANEAQWQLDEEFGFSYTAVDPETVHEWTTLQKQLPDSGEGEVEEWGSPSITTHLEPNPYMPKLREPHKSTAQPAPANHLAYRAPEQLELPPMTLHTQAFYSYCNRPETAACVRLTSKLLSLTNGDAKRRATATLLFKTLVEMLKFRFMAATDACCYWRGGVDHQSGAFVGFFTFTTSLKKFVGEYMRQMRNISQLDRHVFYAQKQLTVKQLLGKFKEQPLNQILNHMYRRCITNAAVCPYEDLDAFKHVSFADAEEMLRSDCFWDELCADWLFLGSCSQQTATEIATEVAQLLRPAHDSAELRRSLLHTVAVAWDNKKIREFQTCALLGTVAVNLNVLLGVRTPECLAKALLLVRLMQPHIVDRVERVHGLKGSFEVVQEDDNVTLRLSADSEGTGSATLSRALESLLDHFVKLLRTAVTEEQFNRVAQQELQALRHPETVVEALKGFYAKLQDNTFDFKFEERLRHAIANESLASLRGWAETLNDQQFITCCLGQAVDLRQIDVKETEPVFARATQVRFI